MITDSQAFNSACLGKKIEKYGRPQDHSDTNIRLLCGTKLSRKPESN
jgi:hypothetical protein